MPQHDNAVLICMPFGKATWIDRFYEETVKPIISELANSVRIDYPVADWIVELREKVERVIAMLFDVSRTEGYNFNSNGWAN